MHVYVHMVCVYSVYPSSYVWCNTCIRGWRRYGTSINKGDDHHRVSLSEHQTARFSVLSYHTCRLHMVSNRATTVTWAWGKLHIQITRWVPAMNEYHSCTIIPSLKVTFVPPMFDWLCSLPSTVSVSYLNQCVLQFQWFCSWFLSWERTRTGDLSRSMQL